MPKTGIEDGFEEMGHRLEQSDLKTGETGLPFQNSVASGNLPLGRPEKSCSFPTTTIIQFKDARERRSKFNFPKTEQFSRLSRNLKLGSALRFITLRLGQV